MKSEKGLGMVGAIILILIVIVVIGGIAYYAKINLSKTKNEDIKANMLLIQGACKVTNQNSVVKKSADILIGTKLSVADDNLINEFKKLEIIPEADYEKYYMLSDENLEKLKLDVRNEKDSYYIINYENSEVIITKGYNGKYKLSEIIND